jgi:hypothetical protein
MVQCWYCSWSWTFTPCTSGQRCYVSKKPTDFIFRLKQIGKWVSGHISLFSAANSPDPWVWWTANPHNTGTQNEQADLTVMLCACIWEMLCLNLGWATEYSDWGLLWFTQSLPVNAKKTVLQLGHDCSFPNPFHLIQQSSPYSTLHSRRHWQRHKINRNTHYNHEVSNGFTLSHAARLSIKLSKSYSLHVLTYKSSSGVLKL